MLAPLSKGLMRSSLILTTTSKSSLKRDADLRLCFIKPIFRFQTNSGNITSLAPSGSYSLVAKRPVTRKRSKLPHSMISGFSP